MAQRAPRTQATPARTFEVTELVAQASGYVIVKGKRVDKFTLTSPVAYEPDKLQEWLEKLPEHVQAASDETAVNAS
jgi:hypothetical protein